MTGSAVRYGSEGTTAYEQWKKIKIREEEAIGKLTKKKKKKRKAKMEREKNEWNEECKSEKRRLFQSTIFKEGGGRQRRKNRRHVFFKRRGQERSIRVLRFSWDSTSRT